MNKRFLLLLVSVLFFITSFIISIKTQAQFGGVLVYPNVLELDFSGDSKKFVSRVVQVENPTDKPFRVRAYTENWNLDRFGKIIFLDKPDKTSLDTYIKYSPKEFDLAPGQKQMVRVTAKLPEGTDGEFRSIIFFETVNPKQDILQQSKGKYNISVNFKARYGVTVYAYKGNVIRTAALQDLKYEKIDNNHYLIATLKNDGNIHSSVLGDLTLTPKSSSNAITSPLAKYTILPTSTQKYRIQLPEDLMTNDNYTASLKLNYKDQEGKVQIIEAQTNFDYKASKTYVKRDLKNPSAKQYENIKMTPENVAKPMQLDLEEIKLK